MDVLTPSPPPLVSSISKITVQKSDSFFGKLILPYLEIFYSVLLPSEQIAGSNLSLPAWPTNKGDGGGKLN